MQRPIWLQIFNEALENGFLNTDEGQAIPGQ